MNTPDQALFEKIKQLPPQRLAEVEDFVDFLHTREAEQGLTHAAAKASGTSKLSGRAPAPSRQARRARHAADNIKPVQGKQAPNSTAPKYQNGCTR